MGTITLQYGTTHTPTPFTAGIGIWSLTNPFSRPGVILLRTWDILTSSEQGIFTCTIPDDNGNQISLNVGLYPHGFNGEPNKVIVIIHALTSCLFTVAPTISSLTYQEEIRTLTCVSTGSPPTVVSWMKDGENITIDGADFSLSQTVTDRVSSTYNNTLIVGEGVTGGVAGIYNCTVSNVLGSNSGGITAVGEWSIIVYNFYASELSQNG